MAEIMVDEETEHIAIVEYLCEVCGLKNDRSARMASMTVLSDLLRSVHVSPTTRQICLQAGILTNLEDILDLATAVSPLDGMNILLLMLALQILWLLSMAHVCQQEPMTNSQFISKIMALIRLTNSPLLKFTSASTTCLKKLCEGKHLVGQIGEDFRSVDFSVIPSNSKDPVEQASIAACSPTAWECRLFDTSGSQDVNVTEHFLRNGHGLATQSTNSFPEESWKDILVTHVVAGPYFWCQIGEKVILTAKKIELLLASEELEQCMATVGEYLVVKHDDTFIRCKVLNNYGSYVVVLAIDYGMVVMVTEDMIFKMPLCTGVLYYKAQAQLCCLSGVSPPLLDHNIQQMAISILCNLSRHKVMVGKLLKNLGIFDILKVTLFCPVPCLIIQSLDLINNLINNPRIGYKISTVQTLKWLLEVCDSISNIDISRDDEEKIAYNSLICVCSIIYQHRARRNDLYQLQGLEKTLKIMCRFPNPSFVYKRGVRLLKNYMITLDRSVYDKKETDKKDGGEKPNSKSSVKLKDNDSHIFKPVDFKDEEHSSDEEYYQPTESHRFKISDDEDDENDDIQTVNAGQKPNPLDREQFYILNSNTGLENTTTVELLTSCSLSSVSPDFLAEITCGMFNTGKGGTICFGIESDGVVFGLYLAREERDNFRVGVDKMMNERLKPAILHYQFSVTYVPVVKENPQTESLTPLEDVYVVEIYLESKPDIFYSCNKGQCFYRFGDKTNRLNTQEVRQLVVLEEEALFKKEIHALQSKLSSIKHHLYCEDNNS
ncbi:uncharacterized protein LOC126808632 isoform X1 [Patella vulgata]|uniref:uncharacterized protein LOC126808632 isoform X1 n=1 Tax=Patella vulgata TaxID=6465 RepID=UPI00218098A2|nr:uncharacterized protein LOC126808632 isoform X1 [Patella vulgata]XP_050389479.1 uncharacterized protein LOC126808632 isoform X1 [Patella vulgata]XP_050389480.1 uncharacterized protein LOC126808632 isoform X1 [Patella vulgata]